jgi:hypothetical protein
MVISPKMLERKMGNRGSKSDLVNLINVLKKNEFSRTTAAAKLFN